MFFGLILLFMSTYLCSQHRMARIYWRPAIMLWTKGFPDAEGMMCTWYVTPCDCFQNADSEVPRVCLPLSPDIAVLAREVINGLARSDT